MNIEDFLSYIILPILSTATLLVFIRFLMGPSLSDRVVSLDLLITIGISIIAVYSMVSNRPSFLDIAMIFALIAVLSTVAFSYYLGKRKKNESYFSNDNYFNRYIIYPIGCCRSHYNARFIFAYFCNYKS